MSECGCAIHDRELWLDKITARIDQQTGLPIGTCPFCKCDMHLKQMHRIFHLDKRKRRDFHRWLLEIDPEFDILIRSWGKDDIFNKMPPLWSPDFRLRLNRSKLQLDEFVKYRDACGFTVFHHVQESPRRLGNGDNSLSLLSRMLAMAGIVPNMQRPRLESESFWAAGNTRLAIVALLGVLKKFRVMRDVRWLVGRSVFSFRLYYKWTVGLWRTYPYVWQE